MRYFFLLMLCIITVLCIAGCASESKANSAVLPVPTAETDSDITSDSNKYEMYAGFLGSKHLDDNTFEITYEMLNEGCTEEFSINKGDCIKIDVENIQGTVNVSIQAEDKTLYSKKNIKSESCSVESDINEIFTITVTGDNAKGHLKISKEA